MKPEGIQRKYLNTLCKKSEIEQNRNKVYQVTNRLEQKQN